MYERSARRIDGGGEAATLVTLTGSEVEEEGVIVEEGEEEEEERRGTLCVNADMAVTSPSELLTGILPRAPCGSSESPRPLRDITPGDREN